MINTFLLAVSLLIAPADARKQKVVLSLEDRGKQELNECLAKVSPRVLVAVMDDSKDTAWYADHGYTSEYMHSQRQVVLGCVETAEDYFLMFGAKKREHYSHAEYCSHQSDHAYCDDLGGKLANDEKWIRYFEKEVWAMESLVARISSVVICLDRPKQ
jgi:hypothetical protein